PSRGGRPTQPSPPGKTPRQPQSDLEAAVQRVQSRYRQVEDGDYFTLLDLLPDATVEQIEEAYQRLRAQFVPAALPIRCRSAMDRELRQIIHVFDEAHLVLTDPELRAAYVAQLLPAPGEAAPSAATQKSAAPR